MGKYTLTSYEPINIELPKPQVPESLVNTQIEKMLEPLSAYHEVGEDRGVILGDYLVVTTKDACMDGNPARNFLMEHSVYHVGAGEMPKTFDDELMGIRPGETKSVSAEIKLPVSPKDGPSVLTMDVTVEKILYMVMPELTDELVQEHFAPATTVEQFREGVAKRFGLPDMAKDDPKFPDLVLEELSKRLVEEPDPADRIDGMPADALRMTCAIDALADHLQIELNEDQIIAQMPGDDFEQRQKIYLQLKGRGLTAEARVFALREAALSWLVNNSNVCYR